MNFYKRHLGDIAKACGHLSQGQMGAYDLLLDWLYSNEKPLPASRVAMCRIARAEKKQERSNVDFIISEFLTLTPEGYTQKRVMEEIAKANEQAEVNRRIAEEREAKRRARIEHASCNEPSNDSCTNGQPSQTPDTRHQTPEKEKKKIHPPAPPVPPADAGSKSISAQDLVAEGVEEAVAKDWIWLRKAKRAPLTRTALDGIKREAKKANITFPDAIRMAAERGWQSFKADWILGQGMAPNTKPAKPEVTVCTHLGCGKPWSTRRGNSAFCHEHAEANFYNAETGPPIDSITKKLVGSFGAMK